MVTDPVQRIRAYVEERPLARNLPALLNRMAQLPPSREAPYLTVSLDWRPEGGHPGRDQAPELKASQRRGGGQEPRPGPSRRPAWETMWRELCDFVEEYERQREGEAVQQVTDNLGPGGTAVAGPEDVVTALLGGQVMMLVVNDDFSSAGWADFDQGVSGVGKLPRAHPYGGEPGDIVAVPLEEELVRLAYQTDATVEIVRTEIPGSTEELMHTIPEAGGERPRADAATRLDEHGGVGAVPRFALSGDQATAEL